MSTAGGISNLFDVARRALAANTQAVRVHGDNIANVNTPGYSRRRAVLVAEASQGLTGSVIGTGVGVSKVERLVDKFVDAELVNRTNDRARAEVRDEFLVRAEDVFAIDGSAGTIGDQLSKFFSSLEDLATNPSSIPLRMQVIQEGAALSNSINTGFNELANLQREADNRLDLLVDDVNSLTSQIAELNFQLGASEIGEQENLTVRDKRDQLVRELTEIVEISTVEASDGKLTVSLKNGFALVQGSNARDLEFNKGPSFSPVDGYPPGLDGAALGHIVFDYDSDPTSASHIDLTGIIANGGGSMGGLLSLRGTQSTSDTDSFHTDGDLVRLGARIEAIARDLLTRFNEKYVGSDVDDDPGHQSSSGDLDGNSPDFDGLFTFSGAIDDDLDGIFRQDDLDAYSAANGMFSSFAKVIDFTISEPRKIAAALDLEGDPTTPDTSFAAGDGRNIENLLALRTEEKTHTVPSANPIFTSTANIEDLYHVAVSYAGSLSDAAKQDTEIYTDREIQLQELRASAAGVSLDEEFARLIVFQRAFEGAARIVSMGNDLLAELMGLMR